MASDNLKKVVSDCVSELMKLKPSMSNFDIAMKLADALREEYRQSINDSLETIEKLKKKHDWL